MAAPNIKNPIAIYGRNGRYAVPVLSGGLPVALLSNPPSSNTVYKINSIFCANVDGSNPADITVSIHDGTTNRYLAFTIAVPADATQIISTKETYFYLEEGHSIRAAASVAGDLELIIGYEEIS
jgi:hypothetical protein